jgi:hypothetical protein
MKEAIVRPSCEKANRIGVQKVLASACVTMASV